MNVLLSIKPKYADKIFDGTKKFEYRNKIWTRTDVDKIVVYVTSPISMVVGEFKVGKIIKDLRRVVWDKTSQFSGLSSNEFYNYFWRDSTATAIKVTGKVLYDKPIPLSSYGISRPPQNFMYLSDEQVDGATEQHIGHTSMLTPYQG